MYIIVVGGGKVGYYLTKHLLAEGHEVLVIEREARKCQAINDELGSVAMHGDGCEAVTLEEAGVGRADVLITVTGDDEDNMVACQVAKHRFHVPRTIARINNPKNENIFKLLGIDTTVSSTQVILAQIEENLPVHFLIPVLHMRGGKLEMVEITVPPRAKVVGKKFKDLSLPSGTLISLINREEGALLPTPETMLAAEDRIVAVTRPEAEESLRQALTQE